MRLYVPPPNFKEAVKERELLPVHSYERIRKRLTSCPPDMIAPNWKRYALLLKEECKDLPMNLYECTDDQLEIIKRVTNLDKYAADIYCDIDRLRYILYYYHHEL